MQCSNCQTPLDESQRFCPNCGTVVAASEVSPPADPMIGQTLGGKYKVLRLLGEGGMGCVYEGEQQLGTTKRKVAIKTLHTHLSRDEKVKARFEREVGTIAELEHPNTIQVYDFGANEEGILYIVMEFLHGRSLADLIEKEGALSPDRVGRILEQVCGSLEEAHGRGIVHRDLKPDNIVLVDRAGKKDFVKVLDFGIAKRANEEDKNEQKLTQQGMVLGTPPYMSPEQFTGKPIDARSDIYSLAVVTYEMLMGRLPFKADTAWEWATQHMTQPPIPMESLAEGMRTPEPMRTAVMRALAKSPADRFQTAKDFYEAFASNSPGLGITPRISDGPSRGKTEVGAPLDIAAAFGASAPVMGSPPPYSPPISAVPPPAVYTPPGINVAMAERGPSRAEGGNRTPLLVGIGMLGLVSIGAIIFALKGSSGEKDVQFGTNPPIPPESTVVLSDSVPSADSAIPTDSAIPSGDLPPLSGGNTHPQTQPHPGPVQPEPKPGPGPGPKPKYDGPDCQIARKLKAQGQTNSHAYKSNMLSCLTQGGSI